jgi:hypothetical protein
LKLSVGEINKKKAALPRLLLKLKGLINGCKSPF